jgi:hypothetical protein
VANSKDQAEIDLSNYKDKVGSRVSEGRYKVVVDDVENDTSSAGNKMVNLWLRVVGGDFNDAMLVDRLVLTEKSLFRVVGFMQAIGLPTPKKKLVVNIRGWVGKALYVDVADGEPYNGRVKSEVKGYERIRTAPTAAAANADNAAVNELAGLISEPGSGGLDEFAKAEQAGVSREEAEAAIRDLPTDVGALDEVDLDQLQL